ncbi:Uncharacterized protein Fot_20631 [Forsythia ovata]|uniref:Uncharacterized protein n=1 Tax=Forsythia ovata TaxID=205694 RepID=A0ABD1USI8_9LAMI
MLGQHSDLGSRCSGGVLGLRTRCSGNTGGALDLVHRCPGNTLASGLSTLAWVFWAVFWPYSWLSLGLSSIGSSLFTMIQLLPFVLLIFGSDGLIMDILPSID